MRERGEKVETEVCDFVRDRQVVTQNQRAMRRCVSVVLFLFNFLLLLPEAVAIKA